MRVKIRSRTTIVKINLSYIWMFTWKLDIADRHLIYKLTLKCEFCDFFPNQLSAKIAL